MVPTTFNDWSLLKSSVAAAGPTLLLLWVCWRSGSWHVLLARMWWALHGSKNPEGRVLRAFYWKRTALMRFRWMTGISVRTLNQGKSLVAWCAKNDEEIGDVRACGMYFDNDLPGLNLVDDQDCACKQKREKRLALPGQWTRRLMSGLIVLTWLGVFASIGLTMVSGAIVTVKQGSGTWLLLYPEHISLLRSSSVNFTMADCAKGEGALATTTGLYPQEVHLVCGWLSDPARSGYIARTVKAQRLASATLALLTLILSFALLRWIMAVGAVSAMQKRLSKKRSPPAMQVLTEDA